MKIKSIEDFTIPENLMEILGEEEYWEDESFDPILITVEETEYDGMEMISYTAEFEVLDKYEDIDGDEWEELIRIYIDEKAPDLLEIVMGDSESATCVIWTNNELDFRKILGLMIELIENKKEVKRIIKKKAGR